ncbi:MAG: RNA methyltransferase [Chitinophagaceae bacterium]|nr:RNA methyltransferase [Chitinophagaceae bacterium]
MAHKKFRQQENAFIAEGSKVVTDLLVSENFACKIICANRTWISENRGLTEKFPLDSVIEITGPQLKKISLLSSPGEVFAVFEKNETHIIPEKQISIMLDEIRDPGNLGTIIRIADWFGVKNIICSEDCVDCYNPKVVQATMGSLGRVNILYTNLDDFLRNHIISMYAATLGGKNIHEFGKIREGIILIGNESKGIKEKLLATSAGRITIPGRGKAESLNAAVACGIILSHVV